MPIVQFPGLSPFGDKPTRAPKPTRVNKSQVQFRKHRDRKPERSKRRYSR